MQIQSSSQHTSSARPLRSLRALRQIIVLLLMAAACSQLIPMARANDLKIGQAAPPLTLRTLGGKSIATSELHGQVVIVTFWATWCAPCHEELPVLSAYAKNHAAEGLQVLAFSLDGPDDLSKVQATAETLSFPVGLLGSARAGGYGRIWRVPVSFVIDRSGRLVYDGWEDGSPAWTEERLKKIVDPIIARTNTPASPSNAPAVGQSIK